MDFVEVAAGPFRMGSPSGHPCERPVHEVWVDAFGIATTPVTNDEYAAYLRATAAPPPAFWRDPAFADPRQPVVGLSWEEALRFARWAGARLPTEVEWEKAATWGQLEETGQVWEWTASTFGGYPGFVAHPYREYSEVFFGDRYRVLRGGSCATHARVATPHFRNWDLPERRQIFSGVRIAA